MVERFCPRCGSENDLAAEFCSKCGIPLGGPTTGAAEPTAPLAPDPARAPGEEPESSSAPALRRKGRWLIVLLAAAVAIGAVVAASDPASHPGGSLGPPPPPPGPAYHTTTVAHEVNRTVDPGPGAGVVQPFSLPPGATNSTLTLNLTVHGCLSILVEICPVDVAVVTPANWSAYVAGGPLETLWCTIANGSECGAVLSIVGGGVSLNVTTPAGLDLVVWNPGLLPVSVSWDAELHYWTTSG